MLNEIWADICEQWIQPVSGKWWEIIIFAIFYFTVVDVGVFFGFSFMHYGDIKEVGYPKLAPHKKKWKKYMNHYSLWERISMARLTFNAENMNFYLILNLFCQWIMIAAMFACVIGFIGSLVSVHSGWARVLLRYPIIYAAAINLIVTFIPGIIFVPSERRRYRFK